MPKHPAYPILRETARQLGLPTSFQTDLTKHDRADLAKRDPSKPFAWFLYPNGTHLVWPEGNPGATVNMKVATAARLIACIASTFAGGRWFVWTGLVLMECASADDAIEALAVSGRLGQQTYREEVAR